MHLFWVCGWGALHYASQQGHVECVKLLLRAGADPTRVNARGWGETPLSLAQVLERGACVAVLEPAVAQWRRWRPAAVRVQACMRSDRDRNVWIINSWGS